MQLNKMMCLICLFLAVCVVCNPWHSTVLATETTDDGMGENLALEPSELESMDTIHPSETTVPEIYPIADDTEDPEPVQSLDNGIVLTWIVDSSLIYHLDEDNFVWMIYDAEGNDVWKTGKDPASAGFIQTSMGDWFGSATITLTITNNLDVEAELKLLFMDLFSGSAAAISNTIVAENDKVTYESAEGVLIIQPDSEGVVTMTVTAGMLQQAQEKLGTIMNVDSNAGWIQVQVISPTTQEQNESEPIVAEPTLEQIEDPTEGLVEIPTQPEQEQNVA